MHSNRSTMFHVFIVLLLVVFAPHAYAKAETQFVFPIPELGGCKNRELCKQYCSKEDNYLACTNYGKKVGAISKETADKNISFIVSKIPLAAQGCARAVIADMINKVQGGSEGGVADVQVIVKNCAPAGTKIPARGAGITTEFLKRMREFLAGSAPQKDLDALRQVETQMKGIVPAGTPLPQNSLNLKDIQNINAKMQEEMNKIPPETLKYLKEQQEKADQEFQQYPAGSAGGGGGMGL